MAIIKAGQHYTFEFKGLILSTAHNYIIIHYFITFLRGEKKELKCAQRDQFYVTHLSGQTIKLHQIYCF
jgi:hypothetical protein